jgi:hypothetical protein
MKEDLSLYGNVGDTVRMAYVITPLTHSFKGNELRQYCIQRCECMSRFHPFDYSVIDHTDSCAVAL